MNIKSVIKSQYLASLEMLKEAVINCPEPLWDDPAYKNRFWHIAYHALFYVHLYLQPTGEDFTPWAKHKDGYEFMGPVPWPPHNEPEIGEPYSKTEVLAYLAYVQEQVGKTMGDLNMEGESGFHWLPMNKMELQIYNIRHLQLHVGELCERLGTAVQIDVGWVGMKSE